ncbi:MFS general substrate transporter [Hesseltinella vesiculosa]|uniref:Lysosomal dipeptide transporter MFSD1 n=1 Tax=Hesseltinella vesiculosa TaxID=101127 RepID=A0A1X2G407_9FUNG|nr:MFS general substrate transporter [Hesseltinella vesiculosa]
MALACVLLLAVGSHFAGHTLGALKNTIKQEFGISNSQYGVIQSSVAIVNTVLPVLGGIFVDAFGTIPGSILTTFLITFGNILVALSTSYKSLNMMILGRILYGIGSGTVVIVQETILSQWFRGRSFAAVVALMLTVSRLASFLAQATVVPIADAAGWYGYGFWFSASLCIFSFIVNLAYIGLLQKIGSSSVSCRKQIEVIKRKKSFSWKKLLFLPHSYWLIAAMELLLGGAWGSFLHINSELVKLRFGYNNAHAAATASVAQILPVFLMPFLGVCTDRLGKRTWMMIGSAVTMLVSMIVLGYTYLPPLLGMLIFSVSLSLGPVGMVSAVPVILPLSLVGTGMGLIKVCTNVGSVIFDIVAGVLQDHDAQKGYDGVIVFFIGISLLAVICGIILLVLDRSLYHGILDRSSREARRETKMANAIPLKQNNYNYIYGAVYAVLTVVSWVLFFHFVLFA